MKPVFIIGPPRSGTTLLMELLDGHPALSVHSSTFHPFHHNLQRFEGAAYRPEHYRLTSGDVTPELREQYQRAILNALEQTPGDHFVLKISTLSQQVDFLRALFPNARFIQMVRDGRDAICSMESLRQALEKQHQQPRALGPAADPFSLWSTNNTDHPHINAAAAWFYHVTRSWLDLCWTSPEDILRIRYEHLVSSPKKTLEGVASFLDLQFPPELHHHLLKITDDPGPVNGLGYSICQAPNQKTGRYKSELSEDVRVAIASLLELPMVLLGYRPDPPPSPTQFERACSRLHLPFEVWSQRVQRETACFQTHRDSFNPTRLFRQASEPLGDDTPLLIDTVVTQTKALLSDGEAGMPISSIGKQDRYFEFSDPELLWPHLAPLLDGKNRVTHLHQKFKGSARIAPLLTALHQRGFLAYTNDR